MGQKSTMRELCWGDKQLWGNIGGNLQDQGEDKRPPEYLAFTKSANPDPSKATFPPKSSCTLLTQSQEGAMLGCKRAAVNWTQTLLKCFKRRNKPARLHKSPRWCEMFAFWYNGGVRTENTMEGPCRANLRRHRCVFPSERQQCWWQWRSDGKKCEPPPPRHPPHHRPHPPPLPPPHHPPNHPPDPSPQPPAMINECRQLMMSWLAASQMHVGYLACPLRVNIGEVCK